ncbi:MAG: cytochrome c biogenesis protein CcsA [bacterium]
MNINYLGEHLMPGMIGNAFVWIAFIAALISTVLFILSIYSKRFSGRKWLSGAKGLYLLHAFSLIGVAVVLYYLIFRHYFEYSYVWQYSSKMLPVKYIIACFWAGQEGSFLTWAIWQALTGVVLLFIAREWEKPVMAVVSLSQVFVTSMLLGVNFIGIKIGASPFTLLRETVNTISGTIFTEPNYLSFLKDGNGLNPLLENVWMTIHPPILFLGYALALVPFAYAIASFIRKDYAGWIGKAIPWTLLSLTLLGAGILLGGAWAYVSLTFGGFWAWDPVENSSLVPWMTLIAGLHFLLIARRQNFALFSAYLFLGLSYILVLYASFLTRSGVLADTSAHSFGDNGMTLQLLIFLLCFLLLLIVMIAINVKKFYEKKKEELLSREFWMFIGSIIVALGAFQIIFTTSIPVFNSIFGTDVAPPADAIGFYNKWQTPFALLIAGFIAFCQFLNYHSNEPRMFIRKMIVPLVLALLITIPFLVTGVVRGVSFTLFLFFILFSILSSLYNLLFQSAKPRNMGAIITHLGFVIFLLGTVITFSNSSVISSNTSKYDLGDSKANAENLMLVRSDTLYMGGFYVAYVNQRLAGNETHYQVDFLKYSNGKFTRQFSLFPSVNVHPRMGAVYNPSTRHFLNRDYYTYIAHVGNAENDYIVIKVIMNPYINVLWVGAILMTIGLGYSAWKRIRGKAVSNT